MGSIADHLIVESMVKRREMLELVVLVLPFLLVLPSEAIQILPESIIDNNRGIFFVYVTYINILLYKLIPHNRFIICSQMGFNSMIHQNR